MLDVSVRLGPFSRALEVLIQKYTKLQYIWHLSETLINHYSFLVNMFSIKRNFTFSLASKNEYNNAETEVPESICGENDRYDDN